MAVLRAYRLKIHPDKFRGDNLKAEAEEKFKEASALLDELGAHIAVFLIVGVVTLKQHVESSVLRRRIDEVCSASYAKDFMHFLTDDDSGGEKTVRNFSEHDVYMFIRGRSRLWKSLLGFLGFRFFQLQTIDQLKNFFIGNLLRKKLVTLSAASGLDRRFLIREPTKYDF